MIKKGSAKSLFVQGLSLRERERGERERESMHFTKVTMKFNNLMIAYK